VAGAAAAALGLAWPVLAPFVEVWRFSQLSGPEVEDVVAIKEPLQVRCTGRGLRLRGRSAAAPQVTVRDAVEGDGCNQQRKLAVTAHCWPAPKDSQSSTTCRKLIAALLAPTPNPTCVCC
jgi:hypothetical protein